MDVTTGSPPTSAMQMGKSGDIMIDCPYCNFARPVAACLATCEENIINWCPKIKTVAIEELDEVAPKALRGKTHLEDEWKRRRPFFLEPVLEVRAAHEDDYDREIHGGGGLKGVEDLMLQDEAAGQQAEEMTEVVDEDIEPGPYASGENTTEVEPDGEPDDFADGPGEEPEPEEPEEADEPEGMEKAGTEAGTEVNETTEEGSSVAQNDTYKYPCPVKSCDGGAQTWRGLKVHIGKSHKNFKGELPKNRDEPKASKKSTKKTSKASKPRQIVDTGKLILVAGSVCAVVHEDNDFSREIATLKEEADLEVKIYRLGPELRVRTIVEELE